MSGQPNICIDIFSQMANMVANFQANREVAGDAFSHDSGFTNDPVNSGSGPSGMNFEDSINGYL